MSPPEVWGPAVWNLFHTLCEQLNENAFKSVAPSLFNMIVRICKFLPCPDCALDATIFLANIKFSDIKNKTDLKMFACVSSCIICDIFLFIILVYCIIEVPLLLDLLNYADVFNPHGCPKTFFVTLTDWSFVTHSG